MDKSKLFTVETTMNKKDYHKFLYIATFLRSKIIIPFFMTLSGIMSFLLTYKETPFNITKFILFWILLLAIAISVVIFKVERKNNQRIKTDRTGFFGSKETLDFYEDYVKIKSTAIEGETKIKYGQFYQVLESKGYFITYFNVNQASLIRKEDMDGDTIEKLRLLYQNVMGKNYKRI